MVKISIGVLCLILAVIFGNAMVVSGESDDESISVPLGVIHLGPPEDVEAKQPSVPFPHGTHFVYTCNTCHHQWEMDGPIENCTTSGCHDGVESPIKAGGGKVDEDGKRRKLEVKVGDRVLFGKFSGTEVKLSGDQVLVMREDDIMGVIE